MDNSNSNAKIALRKHFLNKIKNPEILGCFGGEDRIIYNECYENLNTTALDIKNVDDVLTIDNKKFIASVDISKYNFIDLDAYGSPYELLLNVIKKKQHDPEYVVILTDGLYRNLAYGSGGGLIQTIINNPKKITIPMLNHHHVDIIKLILKKLSTRYNVTISEVKIINESGKNKMRYLGFTCKSESI
jgi:hypothetical protein